MMIHNLRFSHHRQLKIQIAGNANPFRRINILKALS
jgi:hypothetical protein